jgi:hypothetical protein
MNGMLDTERETARGVTGARAVGTRRLFGLGACPAAGSERASRQARRPGVSNRSGHHQII